MKLGILGTGVVGQTIAAKLVDIGQEVMIGTRDVAKVMADTQPNPYGMPPFSVWRQQHPKVGLGTFAEAAAYGEALVNATNGSGTLAALAQAGEANLNGKILIDISNPLDFSQGMPPVLSVSNTDSLGEQIQRTYPQLKVVKTLNTLNANLMVNPGQLAGGDHHIFVSGNEAAAKAQVVQWLQGWFGWREVIDLGDITSARGTEMYLPLWLRLFGAVNNPIFNIKLVRN